MDRFIVFFDAHRPISHFGWEGAFCGAEMQGAITDRHGWGEVTACPACIDTLPLGARHIYRSPTAEEAVCGALRDDDAPITSGIDPSDPELCDRCLLLEGSSYRILEIGAQIPLLAPRVFEPAHILNSPV